MSGLALFGGTPVRRELLPYGRQLLHDDDVAAVLAALRSDWLTQGPRVAAFEAAFAARTGARHAVAFSSGTAALHGAVHAAGVGPGDEVVTTPITFCATANAVLYAGGVPVFADVDPERLLLDPDRASALITPRTRALLPVDYAGHPAAMDAFATLAARHGLCLIEDAAHSVGASLNRRPVGSLARMTTFSFHPVKHIATGEGGMVTTDDDDLAQRLRRFRNHGLSTEAGQRRDGVAWRYDLVELGCNYRLTDVAAALGTSQLRRLDANLARRRDLAARYAAAFADLPAVRCPTVAADATSAWHLYPVRFDVARLGTTRDTVIAALRAEGIGVNVHYVPVPSLSLYRNRGYRAEDCPNAAREAEQLVSLP
ncbi:MAG: DegT/DnrJ/EryC1/StrS family aminotransferase, partial [Planctomycetes bacterium]|nr:DegT/DnrJ/EryC1/StrS family aminotransferase [Planctomycetota bacterium]